jgi:CubicO group peptidase (beta-lactamase class C family)
MRRPIFLATAFIAALVADSAPAAVPPGIRGIAVDEAKVTSHVIKPAHLATAVSDKLPTAEAPKLVIGAKPVVGRVSIPHLNSSKFATALHNGLKDQVVGYAMQLRQHGNPLQTLIWNWSKNPADGSSGWNLDTHMHVASLSKFVTAIAMAKALDDKNISYDAKIIDYLPTYWAKGANVDKITFRNLMQHKSGFSTGGSASDYALMKSKVAAGVSAAYVGQHYDYENMNYGLMRILISTIAGNVDKNMTWAPANLQDNGWDYVTLETYKSYVQLNVFNPSGITAATLTHPAGDALAYKYNDSAKGWDSGDLTTVAGGAGWHMSIKEYLDMMGTFRRKGTIMSAQKAQTVLDGYFGIDIISDTPAGKIYNKNGSWKDAGGAAGHTEQTLAYFLPDDMELVVFLNSPLGAQDTFFRDYVTNIIAANIE